MLLSESINHTSKDPDFFNKQWSEENPDLAQLNKEKKNTDKKESQWQVSTRFNAETIEANA